MKRNKAGEGGYHQLYRKLMLRLLAAIAASAAAVILLYRCVWYQRGGNMVLEFLQQYFSMSYDDALRVYWLVFRNNDWFFAMAAFTVVFFLLLRFVLRWFTRYFDCVNQGIDDLLEETGELHLPPEMRETESKLNTVRETLKRRSLEAELAEQRKNDLVMYLAHDIRTPLTSVIGYLSLLDEAPDMPQAQRAKYTHITLDKASRLEGLVNEFFEITRYNLQHISLVKEPIDLCYMLVQLADEFYPILSAKGNAAVLRADEDLTVRGDPDKLARVFNNILKNAAAYSYANSEIVISARELGDQMVISFENQGPTIPAEKLSMIFDRFYRMDEARGSNAGGAGLGLAIAKEIVTLHNGTITAESRENITRFTVSLPAGG